jgi:hypothetical protein
VNLRVFWGFARIVRPAYLGASRAAARFCDRRLGITTTDEVVVRELGRALDDDYRFACRAISHLGIERLMRKLEPSQRDALWDVGRGARSALQHSIRSPE